MANPLSEAGGDHPTVALPLPGNANTPCGADGADAGKIVALPSPSLIPVAFKTSVADAATKPDPPPPPPATMTRFAFVSPPWRTSVDPPPAPPHVPAAPPPLKPFEPPTRTCNVSPGVTVIVALT